jgi:16S rRNA (cytidine1402-2'-O)-methyltransferase
VECLPGATAFVPALVASGLPCERFTFEGFLPQKKGRNTRLQELQSEPRTMIIYESPYRIVKSLAQFAEVFGADRRIAAVREISKKFEECVRGTIAEVLTHFTEHEPKGEFVLIIEGAPQTKNKDKKKKDNYKNRDEE